MALLGLFGLVAGGAGGWFAAAFIMKLGLLGVWFRILGAVLSSLTVGLANAIAGLPPITTGWLCAWLPSFGFSLCASASTVYAFSVQSHRAPWLAILLAVVAALFDLVKIGMALRAKARSMAEDYVERMRAAARYGSY